jgi:glycosyltransferase involved in cell wall biosynthesis
MYIDNLCSVVIPVWNTSFSYLEESLDSLLGQTYQPIEVIVVFDGLNCPDYQKCIRKYERPNVRTFEIPHVGIGGALNFGLEKARGRFFVRADADDVYLSDRLSRQVAALRQSSAAICGSGFRHLQSTSSGAPGAQDTEVKTFPQQDRQIKLACCLENNIAHSSVCIDRKKLSQDLVYSSVKHEDYDLWSRLAATETFINLPIPLVLYRRHDGQYTNRTNYGLMIRSRWRFVTSLPVLLRPFGLGLMSIAMAKGLTSKMFH